MTSTDVAELRECPFCGGEAEIVNIEEGENVGGSCVCCTRCLASSNVEFEFKENFVDNWNRRSDATLTALQARLTEAMTIAVIKALREPSDRALLAALSIYQATFRDDPEMVGKPVNEVGRIAMTRALTAAIDSILSEHEAGG